MWNLTLVTPPDHKALVSVVDFKAEYSNVTESDSLIQEMLEDATSRVERKVNRPLSRAAWTEHSEGTDRLDIFLQLRPIITIDAVTYGGAVQTASNYILGSAEEGQIWNASGFPTTWTWANSLDPNLWAFTVVAGYFGTAEDVISQSITVNTTDNSYSSAGLFPTHLKAGDWVDVSGYTTGNVANNGTRRVLAIVTPRSKFTVDAVVPDLVSATASASIKFSNTPGAIRKAIKLFARESQLQRSQNTNLQREKIGNVISDLTWKTNSKNDKSVDEQVDELLAPFMPKRSFSVELLRA